MKIAVSIETKDRRLSGGTNYLGQTLANLARTDFWSSPALHSLRIVCGGELEDFVEREVEPFIPAGCSLEYIQAPPICTRQQNGARAIRAGADTDADWVMKLEDDLDFLDTFMESTSAWLNDYGHADVPMFSLAATFEQVSQSRFCEGESLLDGKFGPSFPRARALMARGDAIAAVAVLGYWGAQALLWKRPVAQQLADWLGDDPFLWDGKEQHRERGHDLLLQVWGKSVNGQAFAVAVPSFVQHTGLQSNINNPFFEFPFPGRQWSYQRRT